MRNKTDLFRIMFTKFKNMGFKNNYIWGQSALNGNTENGFLGVSPFAAYEWISFKRDPAQIHQDFFPAAQVYQNGSIIAVEDSGCNCLSKFSQKETSQYEIVGVDDRIYRYTLYIFVSTDGLKLENAFKQCAAPKDDEVYLFIENNINDYSKQKLYAKFGKETLKENSGNKSLTGSFTSSLINQLIAKYPGLELTDSTLTRLLNEEQVEAPQSFVMAFVEMFMSLGSIVTTLQGLVGDLIDSVGEGIGKYLTLPENVWNSDSDSYLFKKENLIKALSIDDSTISAVEQFIFKALPDNYIMQITGLTNQITSKSVAGVRVFANLYNNFLKEVIELHYSTFGQLIEATDSLFKLSELVAFFCGIWNGLIDFIATTLQFIGQLIKLPNALLSDFQYYLELFDNFTDAFHNFKWADFWDAFQESFKNIKEYFKKQGADELNTDKLAYAAGFGIAFVATFFIPYTQIAKLANIAKVGKIGLPAGFLDDIGNAISKGSKAIAASAQQIADEAGRSLRFIIALLGKGKEELKAFFDRIWKTIADWFLKNKKIIVDAEKLLQRIAQTYAKAYPDGKLYKLLNLNRARKLYGQIGKKLVQEVDSAFETIIKNAKTINEYKRKVMVSGMVYKGDKSQMVFTAVNFTEKEINAGKLATFLEKELHPVLNARYEVHLQKAGQGLLNASPQRVVTAGIAGSHGEIRALNDLLFYLERSGVTVTDDIFKEIMAYNRFLQKTGVQPPCVHCFYMTDGVQYIGLIN